MRLSVVTVTRPVPRAAPLLRWPTAVSRALAVHSRGRATLTEPPLLTKHLWQPRLSLSSPLLAMESHMALRWQVATFLRKGPRVFGNTEPSTPRQSSRGKTSQGTAARHVLIEQRAERPPALLSSRHTALETSGTTYPIRILPS